MHKFDLARWVTWVCVHLMYTHIQTLCVHTPVHAVSLLQLLRMCTKRVTVSIRIRIRS